MATLTDHPVKQGDDSEVWTWPKHCPWHTASGQFWVASFDPEPQHCKVQDADMEIDCPTKVTAIWEVHREGKACLVEQAVGPPGNNLKAEIDCPPDKASTIVEMTPGVCQTFGDKPKPVPCSWR